MPLITPWAPVRSLLAVSLLVFGAVTAAAADVLVLDFGLNDDTLLPRVPAELERTAAVAPVVRARLRELGHEIVPPPATEALQDDAGTGYRYLRAHPQAAAELGHEAGARWVAIGRVDKPSFLFAYFVIDLVDADTGQVVAHLERSPRGGAGEASVQRRAAERLADDLHEVIVERAEPRPTQALPAASR